MGNSMQFPQSTKNKSTNDSVNIASEYSPKKIKTLTGKEICIYIYAHTYIYIYIYQTGNVKVIWSHL